MTNCHHGVTIVLRFHEGISVCSYATLERMLGLRIPVSEPDTILNRAITTIEPYDL